LNGWNILNSTLYYFMFQHSMIPLFSLGIGRRIFRILLSFAKRLDILTY
jgi:hypothetical protein